MSPVDSRAAVYDRGSTPTLNRDLCTALGWDLDRLHAAYKEADHRLRPAGLKITRAHGEAAIVPLLDNAQQRSQLNHAHAATKGRSLSHYQAVYSLLQGRAWAEVSAYNTARRRIVAGALINLGLLTQDRVNPRLPDAITFGDPTLG